MHQRILHRWLIAICAGLMGYAAGEAYAQQSTGTISGRIDPPSSLPSTTVHAILVEESTGATVQQSAVGRDGSFTLRDVPYARYYLQLAMDDTSLLAERFVVVSSSVPVHITITSLRRVPSKSVQVVGSRALDRTGTHTFYTAAAIRQMPQATREKGIETVLLNTPGVVPDEDGRMHVRGEDAQLQYMIDGIPITANMTRVYSSLFNIGLVKSIDIQTGGLSAEYGRATSAVLSVTTKSGFDRPAFVNAHGSIGSFGAREGGVEVGGQIADRVGLYGAASASRSDRYLDPIVLGDPVHAAGHGEHYFGKADFLVSNSIDLDILGGYNHTLYQVPNGKTVTPSQDQQQDLTDYLIGGRLNAEIGDSSVISLLGYTRHAHTLFTSGGLRQIVTPADSLKAVSENEKFFIGGERTNDATGGSLEYSMRLGLGESYHIIKVGGGGEVYPLEEFFTFAVTNPDISNPDSAGGDARYQAIDLTRGGRPLLVDQSKEGNSFYGYAQDRITLDRWTLDVGLRYDLFELIGRESGISPRLAVAYSLNDDLVLRASYNRIIMQPPVENILVSSSQEARMLAAGEQGSTPVEVKSERAHVMEAGAAWKIDDNFALDLAGYGKLLENFIVKVELGNSGIIFPVNLKEGLVAGGEIHATMHDWHNLSGFLSLAGGVALGMKPEDGSSPIAAGLILGEEGKNYSHPFSAEEVFPTEHSQLLTGSFSLTYGDPWGWFATLEGRFDSGLPFDLTGRNGEGLSPEESRAELKRRGYSDEVIDLLSLEMEEPGSPDKSVAPHATFDLAAGVDLTRAIGAHIRLSLDVLNVLDTHFLYKFESSFGGTHFGYPRLLALHLEAGL